VLIRVEGVTSTGVRCFGITVDTFVAGTPPPGPATRRMLRAPVSAPIKSPM